eukprot:SAG11_NODE_6301_length_1342_cov_1.228479_1_plen_104_part_10
MHGHRQAVVKHVSVRADHKDVGFVDGRFFIFISMILSSSDSEVTDSIIVIFTIELHNIRELDRVDLIISTILALKFKSCQPYHLHNVSITVQHSIMSALLNSTC